MLSNLRECDTLVRINVEYFAEKVLQFRGTGVKEFHFRILDTFAVRETLCLLHELLVYKLTVLDVGTDSCMKKNLLKGNSLLSMK